MKVLKEAAHAYCVQFVEERLKRAKLQITELEHALTSETKSSAGDKHETGRAMIQLEREKLGRQLAELEKTQQLLSKVPRARDTQTVGLGNLVITDAFSYYIAISAGEFKHEGKAIYCISAATPIAQLLLGKSIGQAFTFNGKTTSVVTIV
ncbi:3-oxoacyl-ACP synthase [Maribacter sp. X9]|uniref:3-oxoacyl-ACP synthase n=1 Tax=Maribacter sp. X9 TaxID=3402159 RepID=UPI003AF3D6D1